MTTHHHLQPWFCVKENQIEGGFNLHYLPARKIANRHRAKRNISRGVCSNRLGLTNSTMYPIGSNFSWIGKPYLKA